MADPTPEDGSILSPCPFCSYKSEPVLYQPNEIQWVVRCPACGSTGAQGDNSGKAVEYWNRRRSDARIAALEEALHKAERAIIALEKVAPLKDLPGDYRMDTLDIVQRTLTPEGEGK